MTEGGKKKQKGRKERRRGRREEGKSTTHLYSIFTALGDKGAETDRWIYEVYCQAILAKSMGSGFKKRPISKRSGGKR